MLSDLRFAFRSLGRNRSFTLVTVLTLALGIGSAAAIFSVTDRILFRTSKFPENVFLIGGHNDRTPFMLYRSDFMARAYAAQNNVVAEFSKAAFMNGNIVLDGQPVETAWNGVGAGFFTMLGIAPALGRGFLPGEDIEGADHVVVVSHQFWRNHLGGRPDALGRKITVGDAVCTVVGVLREAQTLPAFCPNDVFRPLTYPINPEEPWQPYLYLLGRLRPGITRAQAEQGLQAIKVDVPAIARSYWFNDRPVLSSLTEVNKTYRPEIYWLVFGAVGFLYGIACLNASNLMLVRVLGQQRELSIRLALGGGRWRIIRLLAIESVTLALLGSLAGLLVANWIFPLLLGVAGNTDLTQGGATWSLGWRAVGVMALLTITTSLLIVIVPAFRIFRSEISSSLKEGGAALGESRSLARLRNVFVVLQVAFAIILLAGSGLMIRSIHNLQKVDLGFDPANRVKVQLGFPLDYPSAAEPRLARLRQIEAELRRVPGVGAVGFGINILLPGYYIPDYVVEGPDRRPIKAAMARFAAGFQDASGLALKRGRWLTRTAGQEVMVNESLARACWPGQDPVGQFLRTVNTSADRGPDWKGWVVAGVVSDVRSTVRDIPGNYFYWPEGYWPSDYDTFIVRLAGNYNEAIASLIRRQLYSFDSRIVVNQILPLSRLRDTELWAERMADSVLQVLAGIALVLTVVGIFSVLAYTVDRRKGEFGVRLAMGATRRDLAELVMRRGLFLTFIGVVLGNVGALALTRYLQSLLFETSALDPWTLAMVGLILLLSSTLACVVPSWRASKVDISRLLRSE